MVTGASPRAPLLAAVLLLAAVASAGFAPGAAAAHPAYAAVQAAPDPVRVASAEGITEYRLANGMKVLLFPDPSQASVTVNVTYFVGSKHESYGETGMAHLLEHLVFKGTERHPDIPAEISRRGGRANGTTWFERTNYFQTMPPTDENLDWALAMEADRMVNSLIRAEDLESEMTVVRNEWEAGENSPFGVLQKRLMAAAYHWHGYGRSTIGERSDIENVPIERLREFYRRYYQPDNAVLIVAGRFDEERVLDRVQQTFGAIPRPDRSRPEMVIHPTYTREPTQDGERRVTVRRVGDVQLLMATYHVPPGSHDDYAAVDVLAHVLGNAPSGRLYQALVETGKASRVFATARALPEPGQLIAFAEVRLEQSLEEAEAALLRTLDEIAANPPTEDEVERARASYLRSFRLTMNNLDRVGIWLSEWEALGDWRTAFIHRDRLRRVSPDDVARVAAAYLIPSNRTLGLFIPEPEEPLRAHIPDAPDLAALVADYEGDDPALAADAFEPTPENVDAQTRRIELPGGTQAALLAKPTRGGAVTVIMNLRLGDEESLRGRATEAGLAHAMLMRGTLRRSRQELIDELARLDAQMNVFGSTTQAIARVETVRENLADVLRLLAEVLREPAFDEREFETLRRERLASLESQRSEPGPRASNALNRHLSPWPEDHPFYTSTFDEAIERTRAVSLDGVRRLYQDVYGAGPSATFAAVGDYDAAEIEALLGELFTDWQPATPFQRIGQDYHDAEPADIIIETPDKANAFFFAGHNIQIRDDDPDFPALVLGNYLLGGGFLSSRLAVRLRQQEGLSYGVSSSFSAHPINDAGRFSVFAIYAPENVDRVETAVREELERALRDGFSDDEVEAAITGWLQSREVARATDGQLVSMLNNGLYFDRTMAHDADLEARVAALGPDEIVEALRRHLDLDRLSVVKAGDFGRHVAATQ